MPTTLPAPVDLQILYDQDDIRFAQQLTHWERNRPRRPATITLRSILGWWLALLAYPQKPESWQEYYDRQW